VDASGRVLGQKAQQLQARCGYEFVRKELARRALTIGKTFQCAELVGDAMYGGMVAVWLPQELARQAGRQRQQEEEAKEAAAVARAGTPSTAASSSETSVSW